MEEIFDINESRALIFEDKEGRFTLSPRGCFQSALCGTKITENDDPFKINESDDFDGAFKVLVKRFKERKWLDYDEEIKDKGDEKEQEKVFVDTVLGFFPSATKQQATAAFDLFFILLEKHGHTR